MVKTFNVCGRCGKSHDSESKKDFALVSERQLADSKHNCGFVAIRCTSVKCGGEKAACRAVLAYLRRTASREK